MQSTPRAFTTSLPRYAVAPNTDLVDMIDPYPIFACAILGNRGASLNRESRHWGKFDRRVLTITLEPEPPQYEQTTLSSMS